MKPTASLFAKILSWFFLNMVIVAAALMVFFIFQQRINLQALVGRQGADRLQTTGMLIAHDLSLAPQTDWNDVLFRHAAVHKVDFTIILPNGAIFSSTDENMPPKIRIKARGVLRQRPAKKRSMPRRMMDNRQHQSAGQPPMAPDRPLQNEMTRKKFSMHSTGFDKMPYFRMQTRKPTRYWSGLRIPLPRGQGLPPVPAMLLAVSDAFTGHGFFFDPLPWIVVSGLVIVISVLFWIPMVRHITRPLARMTGATEKIAEGSFDITINEPRTDEIGRLASSFNFMASSLEERSRQLTSLNKNLEEKVRARTQALEDANREMAEAYHELKETQFQLVQSEKLASLGQLVAGIAHEIKNPLNFIYGNTGFLRDYIGKLEELVALYEKEAILEGAPREKIERFKEEIGYRFIIKDLGTLVDNFEEGAERIHSIVGDLRTFSRIETGEFKEIDLHEAIDLALNLLHNEFKGRVEIVRNYGSLPPIECQSGKINQVLMNLLINAGQAIPEQGRITITTRQAGDYAEIIIEDNGKGMRPEELEHIFEPFFTTKPVGAGTGLGLSISFAIIQDHKGTITVNSKPGQGARFCVSLPIRHK